ncbi:MAG: hypothetical protein U0869_08300 [Chloroflexota bacterium]
MPATDPDELPDGSDLPGLEDLPAVPGVTGEDGVPHDPEAGAGAPERGLIRLQHWVLEHWPREARRQVAIVLAVTAIFVGTALASAHLLRWIHEWLDLFAYLGLFITCWIGAGGLLVPIPGVRWVGLLMIVQQGATLEPGITAIVAASAMLLGQTSWFLAARAATSAAAKRRAAGEASGAAAATGAADGAAPDVVPAAEPARATQPTPAIAAADPGAAVAVAPPAATAAAAPPDAPTPDASAPEAAPAPTGRRARLAARSARARATTERRLREHAISTLYIAGLVPSPLTSIASSVSGAIGIPIGRFVVAIFAGFLTLASLLAFFGDTLADAIGRLHILG